ncbi:MAG: type III-B CRISPR-associated protein Cas10/Cmr2 [Treponema sp.]|jgi:CRISPR-associated protein Cmr2|nr:type III-B CRISPR-associated protein Cas10/Cmr2 [Treponema sp.]
MTRYLFQASIGPVQDFIKSARRTRDLWFGSIMLSEISKAVARDIKESGGELIFPHSDNLDSDLKYGSKFNVANVILAEYDNEETVKTASAKAKEAAENQWLSFVDEAYEIVKNYVIKDLWDCQKKKGVIEFYSAWYPYDDSSEAGYKNARQQVKRLIDARKNLRDFEQWDGKQGIPKSSLDGLRESVLIDNKKPIITKLFKKKEGESLDLVGCVKRCSGGKTSFPSVVDIAVNPWLRRLAKDQYGLNMIEEIKSLCSTLDEKNIISRTEKNIFPYECHALLPSRYKEIIQEAEKTGKYKPHELAEIKATFKNIEEIISKMKKIHQFEAPYLAILSADGDKMGKAISKLKTPDQHREFSKRLSSFAKNAHNIVNNDHYGACIYTGGDDVFALLPVDEAVQCARALYDLFASLWEEGTEKPTLSVGIAIVHTLEDLELMREFAEKAEKLAKKGIKECKDENNDTERNALAITVRARGNAEIHVREKWSNHQASKPIDKRLQFWMERYARKEIPVRFAYELRKIADFYKEWSDDTISDAMKMDVLNTFKRKDIKLSEDDKKFVKEHIESQIKDSYKSIIELSNELIIAQWLGG